MQREWWSLVCVSLLVSVPSVSAQVTGGMLSVTQAHMSWWGGVARDATARLYDVDADRVELDIGKGEITFRAKKGRVVDLDKLHESIWATRLSGGTGMSLNWIDVTAVGEVVADQAQMHLKVTGSDQYFVLGEDPKAKPKAGEQTPFGRLREALGRGEKVVSVTGRLEGWTGHFPPFLSKLPKKPRVILVMDFETARKESRPAGRAKSRRAKPWRTNWPV